MLYTKKFVFTVSLCAMLAANPVLAVTNPVEAKAAAKSGTPGVVSTVYSDWAGRATSGIAGVSYVNSAVDAAGNAAQWAENHAAVAAQNAASAAKSASDAAGSAADAHDTLKKAVQRSSETAAVGSATLPVYVRADGTVATITSYQGKATTAGTADKAIADKNGAQIDTTYEKLSNKVTALSANSTDTQYPSAKAVYTELGKKQAALGYTAENTANKVTTLSATSTNTQYPGAKLVYDELAKKENTANKVTTLSATSTDTQYPSAKAVYTELGKKQAALGYTAENAANKVTTLSANSTDTQYPSAKAVYTELGKKQAALGYTAENTANKVTTLSATSTNTQYPGAKLVHDELAKKVDKDQGADNKNKAMVTNEAGSVYAGYITNDMIATAEDEIGQPLLSWSGKARWAQLGSAGLANSAVTTDKIASGAVRMDKIADNTIHLGKLRYINAYASGVVSDGIPLITDGATGLALSQISSVGIADGAVTADKLFMAGIPDGSSTTGFLAYSGTYGNDKGGMEWRLVEADDIADGAVTSGLIADGAVTSNKIATSAVTTDKIAGGAVTSTGIADGAVTARIIANGAVVADKIANSAVTTNKIATSAVTANKIAAGAVTIEKTAGVVGMVPVGGEGATTYGSFWIE